jgi:transcriptional regulator with XRE-family HTH domain
MRGKPTLRDVAARAGCSITTVSNILQGRSHLYREDMVSQVLHAAHELGYRPNSVARSLARRRTATIGVVLDPQHARLTHNLYAHDVLDGILAFLEPRDYDIRLITPRTSDPAAVWRRIDNGSVDGAVLIAPVMGSPLLEWRHYSRLPRRRGREYPARRVRHVVHRYRQRDHDGDADRMGDFSKGTARLGSSRDTRCTGARASASRRSDARWRATTSPSAKSGCNRATIAPNRACVQRSNSCASPTCRPSCWRQTTTWRWAFCSSARTHEIAVPDRISVAGFDDSLWAQRMGIPLTTIHHDRYQVGYLAAQQLLHQIETGDTHPQRTLINGVLVVRQSVAMGYALASAATPQLTYSTEGGSRP